MLALGSVIGGSFFVGSSVAINAAGPAVIIPFVFCGLLVYYILFAISEMTIANTGHGSFRTFAANAFGEGAGFVVGWMYWVGMVLCMSSEATAAAILMREWFPSLSVPLASTILIAAITLLNLAGAVLLARLESIFSVVKLFAVVAFIILAVLLILGFVPGRAAVGAGAVATEPLAPRGMRGILGSLLIVMYSYCGFEVIGLAASEADNPTKTIPKAIRSTVFCLIGLYILFIFALLPLIPTSALNENVGPIVAALERHGMGRIGNVMSAVLVSAIISTMLGTMFAAGRMMRSLAEERHAPKWAKDSGEIPYRGILLSGLCMLIALWIGNLLPHVYVFLLSSSGFTILFTYAAIMASHLHFRKHCGCPPNGKCQLPGYPYTTIFTLAALILAMLSMPFVEGQAEGLYAGLALLALFAGAYAIMKAARRKRAGIQHHGRPMPDAEFSKELSEFEIEKNDEGRAK